jgi:hypothetical protein
METTFDFNITDNEYIHHINPSTLLHIKRINNSVAVLYFTDKMNNKINIPDGLAVHTYDFQTNKKFTHNAIHQDYPLCWTDDYVIDLNKKVTLTINNQRKWNIIQS